MAITPHSPPPPSDDDGLDEFAPLDVAAARWAARRHNGLDAQGQAELREWLAADPRHADALDSMTSTMARVKAQRPTAHVRQRHIAPTRLQRWLPQGAAAVTAFALVGSCWLGWEHWQLAPRFEHSYATARGQQLSVTLPDAANGSTLQLDTNTQLSARLYGDRREVALASGQARFSISADATRPFTVKAGALLIRVVGTRFTVRQVATGLAAGQTVVSVEEGHVRVMPTTGPAVELVAGQRWTADVAGRGLGPVTTALPQTDWLGGRVSFDDTPLADALAEFERYGPTRLIVTDPAVAALPVGGSFGAQQGLRFAEQLPQVLPVRLVPRPGGMTEIVAR